MNNQTCPVCEGEITNGDPFDIEENEVTQGMMCENGHEWTDVYTITEQRITNELSN